jgi:hypothetical protein
MRRSFLKIVALLLLATAAASAQAAQTPAAPRGAIGVIAEIDAAHKVIKVKTDAGLIVNVVMRDNTSYKRVGPNVKDIASAPEIAFTDLSVGDRVAATGRTSEDGKEVSAARVLLMTKEDIVKKQQADQAEWQKRGVSGPVTAVDAAANTLTISARGADGVNKPLIVEVSSKTELRRYSQDSIKFDDAKVGKFADIEVGDQVRALGNRSADGAKYAAEEIVSGAFRNLAVTVISVNAAENTMTVADLDNKKQPVTVKVKPDSDMKKMPLQMAQAMATRYTAMADAGRGGAGAAPAAGAGRGGAPPAGGPGGPGGPGGGPGGGRGGRGGGDIQQMMERMPTFTLAELKPGDALMILAAKGADPGKVTAITMLAGVDAIFSATPASQRPMMLGNWSIDMGGGGGGVP